MKFMFQTTNQMNVTGAFYVGLLDRLLGGAGIIKN